MFNIFEEACFVMVVVLLAAILLFSSRVKLAYR